MLPIYPAILRAGLLEWVDDSPPPTPEAIPVHVPLLATPTRTDRGPAMVAALEALAALGGPTGFGDPVEWQRETRADRPLPGRDE